MSRKATDFTDKEIQQIETLAGYGLSTPQIAAVMGISEREFRLRAHEDKINAALESGKGKAQAVIGKALFLRAKEGDVPAIRWWEMTRAKRRATQPEGDDGTTKMQTVIKIERSDES